jgi:acyl-CoA dehydrogenase
MGLRPEEVLGVPKPDWKTEDVVMLEEMATKFL